jgi:hypothetical protein
MTSHIVGFRGWPGLAGWRPPTPPRPQHDRLWQRNALYLFAAAVAGGVPEAFALGAALLAAGPSTVAGALLVPDDLEKRDPCGLEAVQTWARTNRLSTTLGPVPWQVLTLSQFFDPKANVDCGFLAFTPNAYTGRTFVISGDLGRFFGVTAEHCAPARGERWRGAWSVYPPGWGAWRGSGWYRRSPNRPEIKMKVRRAGWQLGWGACGKDTEGRRYGKARPGEFIDVISLAYALDGDRGASYGEHRENFGLAPRELPLQVPVDGAGAVRSIHELALVLDEKAGNWFSSAQERAEGRGRLDLARTSSPGAIAAEILARFRISGPLSKFELSAAEHAAWAESFHGGLCSGDERLFGVPMPCDVRDLTSAFPMCASRLDWWRMLTAASVRRQDVTCDLRALCDRAATEPTVALDPAVWRRFGCTLVGVFPDGEPFPVEVEDEHHPDGRLEVIPTTSPGRTMWFAWADVVAATVRAGRVPRILTATRLVPIGRETGLRRRVPVLPHFVLDVDDDPAIALVRHRRKVKAEDPVLAAELRVVVNALCFGILARFDETRRGSAIGERPGPWNFLPISSSVTAGARLLLGVLDRLVRDRCGLVAYKDTDSSIIAATPEGGAVDLDDGSRVRLLRWAEDDEILALFDPIGVFGEDVPAWKAERGTAEQPLQSIVYGPKRHVQFTLGPGGPAIEDWTEANLGGTYADPPARSGRADDGTCRAWSLAAVRREVVYSLARRIDPLHAVRAEAPWDCGQALPFPAIRRLHAVSPEVLASLPWSLGARPGTAFLRAAPDALYGTDETGGPIALDPGDDLAGWQELAWFDPKTGARVRVTTDRMTDLGAVMVASLASKAAAWSRAPTRQPIEEVTIDPVLVRHLGRVSGVIDADIDGVPGDLRDRRPLYPDSDAQRRALIDRAKTLRPAEFARQAATTPRMARRIAAGYFPRPSTVARIVMALQRAATTARLCALDGCDRPLRGPRARYCCVTHRKRSNKRHERAGSGSA